MALTETRSNETVKKWKDFSKSTYAGVDISVIATLNFSVLEKFFTPKSSYSNKDKEKLKGMYKKDISELEKQLMWFNHFVDYVGNVDSNLYNEACEYADECEEC